MKRFRIILLMACALTALTSMAKEEPRTVYMFGISASFNDSTVYFTPIEQVDSAYIQSHNGFLVHRHEYSNQLRAYMRTRGVKNPTCITFFSLKRKDMEKKLQKVMQKYTGKKASNRYFVRQLSAADFTYDAVAPDEGTVTVVGR